MGFETQVQDEKRLGLRLLGPPEASLEGLPVRFGIKKELALLCYLAAEGGTHSRRGLADLLWPQSEKWRARADLRAVLHKLRKTLGEEVARDGVAGSFVVEDDRLGLEPRGIEVDLEALEAAVSRARGETSPAGGGSSATTAGRRELIGRLQGDLGLYRGEFMEGFSLENAPEFELWLEGERARWRALFGELCEGLSRLEGEEGQTAEAIGTARLWVRYAPLEEAACRRLMELLSGAGESERALLVYEGFQNTLKWELGTEPSTQMQGLSRRLREEVEERASLGAGLLPSAATPALSAFEVPLVGRDEEFGVLASEYRGAREGQTRVVSILGEAGMGKTRLAEEFLIWAGSRGADVLEGAASEEAVLPYGPLVEAIRPRLERERAPDDLLEDVWLSELSRLLPELKQRYPDLPSPTSGGGETAKGALFAAIARLVEALASRAPSGAPLVLFLDDLQWADAATLEVLDYVGKRWAEQEASVLVLIAARPEEPEAGSAFERRLSSLARGLPVRSLALGPLEHEDVEGLLTRLARRTSSSKPPGGSPEETMGSNEAELGLKQLGERLAAETGGQPFYLVETLKVLLEEGMLLVRSGADGERVLEVGPAWRSQKSALRSLLPQSVREVIRARLSRLSAGASELVRAGAVLQRGFDFESVVGVAGLGEAEGLKGLEELTERHLLQEEDSGREEERLLDLSASYSFTHEKIRQVAYTEMGHARRRLLHRGAFEVLQKGGAPAARLAHHALLGGLAEQALRYSLAAGDGAVEVFSVKDAIGHYEKAHDLLTEMQTGSGQLTEPSVSDLEHLYVQLGRAYELTQEWDKAREAHEAMLALAREVQEARLEVIALNNLAILSFPQQDADPPRARRLLEAARRVAEEAGLEEALVETECNLVDLMSFWAGEYEKAGALAREALSSARALEGRPDLVARILWTRTTRAFATGRFEESAAYAEEGAELSRKLAERRPPGASLPSMPSAIALSASWRAGAKTMEVQFLSVLAYDRILQGHLTEGIDIARLSLDVSHEVHERAEATGSLALGLGLVEMGEYEKGLERCRRGTELAREAQNPVVLWHNLDHLGRAYEALLDLERARSVREEMLEVAVQAGPLYEAFTSTRLCKVAVLSEDWEGAYAHIRRAHEVGTSFDVYDGLYLHYGFETLLRGGSESRAREEADRFAERAEENERDRLAYLRCLAMLSEFEGDTQRALDRMREAGALAEKIGLPGELWQVWSKIGELHERRGGDDKAREAFSGASQTLKTLAGNIGDEELREGFLSAPRVRRVLGHD